MFLSKKIIMTILLIISSYTSLNCMKYSYHVHSKHSDGKNNVQEIINHARTLGLDEVGISDHYTLRPNDLPTPKWSLTNLDASIYDVASFSNHKNPMVKCGIEADFFPETVHILKEQFSKLPFDYIIGSIHYVGDLLVTLYPRSLPQEECTKIVKRYWHLVRALAESGVFDIVGHLDVVKKFEITTEADLTEEIDAALDAIKAADMTIELNTSGWYHPCQEQYPSRELLEKCKQRDIPVIVSADAHSAEHLTRDFEKAYALLREVGYTQVAYYVKRQRFFTPL